jgi:hypothetical protein
LDLVLFAASYDLKDKANVYNKKKPSSLTQVVSKENLKALVYFAWNLPPERIILTSKITKIIRERATWLSKKFGGGEDLPLVYPEDFRKTFCRMCVACAVIDLSSDDDFETIIVKDVHVDFMADQIDTIYSNRNCQLDKHAMEYEGENKMGNEYQIAMRLKNHIDESFVGRQKRLSFILQEILRLDPENKKEKLSQVYLRGMLEVNSRTIYEDMKFFITERLVISSRGYLPTPKLFQMWHYLTCLPEDHELFGIINTEI